MPYLQGLTLNARVLCFTGLLSLLTGLVFGLAPAWQSSKLDLQTSLKESSRTASSGRNRFRGLLVVSETALAFMLVVGAGLMIKSTSRLLDVKLGFRPEHLLTMELELPSARYSEEEQIRAFHQQALARIDELPGVVDTATVNWMPMQPGPVDLLLVEGQPPPVPGAVPKASTRVVSANYFRTMGISLLQGRYFSDRDNPSSPSVIIINNALARRLFGEQDPLGHRVSFAGEKPQPIEIVGVVDDERIGALDEDAAQVIYRPFLQQPWPKLTLVVRTAGDPQNLINALRAEVQRIDGDPALYSIATIEQLIADTPSTFLRRYPALLLTVFAALALLLAGVGICGVVSYSVTQRTHEIGIRLSLGAKTSDVLRLVAKEGMSLAFIGIVIGFVGAITLTRLLESLLFSVSPTDPIVLVTVSLSLISVALVACLVPARKATHIDPMAALRRE
jgi:putative ABC transport system permease protein